VVWLNEAAQKLTGWSSDEAAGKPISDVFNIVHETTRRPMMNPLLVAIRTGGPVHIEPESMLISNDGNEVPVEDIATPITMTSGSVVGGVLVFRDVSQTRLLEEQLRHVQKMDAVEQLAAGVAHHFNNMLTVIMGHIELASNSLTAADPVASHLRVIEQTTQQAAELIRQLVAFSYHRADHPVGLNLNERLLHLEPKLRALLPVAIGLTMEVEPTPGLISIDPDQLERVLVNLVLNGRDAMPLGGQLTIRTDQGMYGQSHAVPAGRYVRLIVTDTGVGMTEAVKQRIFEPFFTTKQVGQGTGLGLAICFGIIQHNKGYIVVESKPGQGSTFKIYLPRLGDGG
jgi:PAS domain S-box-containing protein